MKGAFEEGPFFLVEATVHPHVGKRVIVWATDDSTAKYVFGMKLRMPTAYCVVSHLGDLNSAKESLHLSDTQIADLHRGGYVRL